MIQLKYFPGTVCGGLVESENGPDRFACLPDGRVKFASGRKYPSRLVEALERHCWNNCRPARWRHPGRKSSGAWGGFGATASEVRQLMTAWPTKGMNPYLRTYVEALDEAEQMGGPEGIKIQANYIWGYLRAKTPEQKAAKKAIQDIGRGLRGLGCRRCGRR